MKLLLTVLFSFYASLDALILSEHSEFRLNWKQHCMISLLASFCTVIGMKAGTMILPMIHHYTPDETVTIALMFLILYLLNFKVEKHLLIKPILFEAQSASHHDVTGFILGLNNLGMGFLAGLEMLSVFWMMVFSFLFSCLLLYKSKKWNHFPTGKAFSIFLLILMIVLIQAF